jgi:uncharacterized phage infection (PIP) family protein YhgE
VSIWRINGPLAASLSKIATAAETSLKFIDEGLQRVDPLLGQLQDSMKIVDDNAEQLKADMRTDSPLIGLAEQVLDIEIRPKVDLALNTFYSLREVLNSVNATVEMLNNIPFINLDSIGDAMDKITDLFEQVDAAIRQIETGVQGLKQTVSAEVIQPIQDQAKQVDQRLQEAQTEVQVVQRKVSLAYEVVHLVGPRISQMITALSVFLTVQLLWSMLTQAAVIYLAWMVWKYRRLDLHKLLAGEVKA